MLTNGFPTCDQTLAGISGGQGVDAVRRVRDLISSVFDGDGVTSRHVWDVEHSVGPIPVVSDVCLLGFSLWVLQTRSQSLMCW